MDWLTNELLFYGGTVCAVAVLAAEAAYLLIFRLRMRHIETQMDFEYGIGTEKQSEK